MSDLRELYQEVIIDHNRSPRNFHDMENANRSAEGNNPLCGDRITLYLKIENGIITDISFQGCGCAIATASASLMTEKLKGMTEEEALSIFENMHEMLTLKDAKLDKAQKQRLGKLSVLSGVHAYPMRVKCATLAWHTLRAALADKHETVTTE